MQRLQRFQHHRFYRKPFVRQRVRTCSTYLVQTMTENWQNKRWARATTHHVRNKVDSLAQLVRPSSGKMVRGVREHNNNRNTPTLLLGTVLELSRGGRVRPGHLPAGRDLRIDHCRTAFTAMMHSVKGFDAKSERPPLLPISLLEQNQDAWRVKEEHREESTVSAVQSKTNSRDEQDR